MFRPFVTLAAFAAGSLLWAGQVAFTPQRWPDDAAGVIATFMVVLTAVAIVGVSIAGGRWARRLAVVISLVWLAVAPAIEVGPLWWAAVTVTGVGLGAILGTGLAPMVRRLPAAAGPPGEAVVLALVLLGAPVIVGLVSTDGLGWIGWLGVAGTTLSGVLYSKAAPGALLSVRVIAPLTLLSVGTASLGTSLLNGATVLLWASAVTRLAWTQSARVAVRPLVERGTPVSIPPELTPAEVLDAAGIDRQGRRRGRS